MRRIGGRVARDFMAHAEQHGLQFVSELDFRSALPNFYPKGVTESLAAAAEARAAATVARELSLVSPAGPLGGVAAEHASAMVVAALTTLDRLADLGWRAVVGDGPAGGGLMALGGDAVADRTEAFDPLGALG